ncbi:protein NRT1/ PTR FAMILY 8.1-like [Papaver somniferum]|uniref:protein NRT1/ PTR FAMILY 8.1-like n=1 Tax=Papaver somniferum TaxID=3469 RepID=UPI000E701809|nr:protein NRT1/ PTR FAMILY 8.1-like [Papaver somniferum]
MDIVEYTGDGTTDFRKNPAVREKTGYWKACYFIIGNEFCERLAYYGMSTNLVNYLETRLNLGNAKAATQVSLWSGTCYLTPLLGALVADAWFGRYWTIAGFSILYALGMALLTLSASLRGLKPTCDNNGACSASLGRTFAFFVPLYLVALGTGGIKPCVSSFGGDQFDDTHEVEKVKKAAFFNWFYFAINVGALIASSVLVWVQMNVGWDWGFGIPAIAMMIAVVSFFAGTRLYRYQTPGGSPFTRICQVIVASFKKSGVQVPEDKSLLYEISDGKSDIVGSRMLNHTDGLSFFDKAAVQTETDRASQNRWRLCTVTQVEELKAIIRILPIWATGIVFSAVYSQMSTMYVLQGNTMDPHIGKFKIPSASLSTFDTISVIIWVPLYSKFIVPFARKYTGHKEGFTQLQRMGIGLVISIFAMLAAGILEVVRLDMVRKNNYYDVEYLPMSILWQIPQYLLIGCAEVFTFVGQLEFYYAEAPDAMRSLCSALNLTTVSLGNYLSSFLVTIVTAISTRNGQLGWIPDNLNRGHLDYFYWVLTALSAVNFVVYLFIAKRYTCTSKTAIAKAG